MALSKAAQQITDKEENGLRLHLLLQKCNETLHALFHKYYSVDPGTLYQELTKKKPELTVLKKQGKLSQTQWNILYPQNRMTDSTTFDVTLISLLLRQVCNIQPPKTGWLKEPQKSDHTLGANLVRIRHIRNQLLHRASLEIDFQEFCKLWQNLSSILLALGCSQSDISDVKLCALDPWTVRKLNQVEQDLQKSQNSIAHLTNCLDTVWWNVAPNVRNYFGRENELTNLHGMILNASNTFGALITGMAGVGKTELVKRYCHVYGKSCYDDNVIWIDGDGLNSLESSFFKVAEFLELPVRDGYGNASNISIVVAKVYRFFAKQKCLFVFDNANSFNEIEDFLPTINAKPTMLVTSQFKDWRDSFVMQELDTFPSPTAEIFIKQNLPPQQRCSEESLSQLSDLMGNHPLALQQAVSYIHWNRISISRYIELFQKHQDMLLSIQDEGTMYKRTVLTTWKMALDKLQENVQAVNLINFMSFMNGKSISKDIFLHRQMNEIELNKALSTLSSYSLIHMTANEECITLKLHSLMQMVVRQTAPSDCPRLLLDVLKTKIDFSLEYQFHFGGDWLEHVYIFQVSTMNKDLMRYFFEFRSFLRQALHNKGKYMLCSNLFRSILVKIEPFANNSMQEVNDIRKDISKSLQYAGKFTEAELELKKLIEQEETQLNRQEREVVSNKQGKQAKLEFKNSIEEEETPLNRQEREVISNRQGRVVMLKFSLAIATLFRGNYVDSSILLKETKISIIQLWGELHPSMNDVEHGLGLCLLNEGKYRKALKIFKQVEQNQKEIDFAPRDIIEQDRLLKQEGKLQDAISVKSSIAHCLLKLKHRKKALKLFQEIEEERTRCLGECHPSTLQQRCNTATCIAQHFNLRRGMDMLKEIEKLQIELLEDEKHPHVLATQYNIGKTYLKRKRYNEVLTVFATLLNKQRDVFGNDHPKTKEINDIIKFCEEKEGKCKC